MGCAVAPGYHATAQVCKNKYSSYCASELDPERAGMMPSSTATTIADSGAADNRSQARDGHLNVCPDVTPDSRRCCSRDTVIISQHEVLHHGHSHAHSHAHSAPGSISSVAIMVGAVENFPIIITSYVIFPRSSSGTGSTTWRTVSPSGRPSLTAT